MSAVVEPNRIGSFVEVELSKAPERYRLSEAFVPKARYQDREFLQREMEKIFPVSWLMACRVEELHDVGDYVEYEIGTTSIVIVREGKDTISAYHNACRHRGTRLAAGRGRVGELRCPFHGWRWNLDGSIKLVLDREEFLPRSDEDYALVPVRVDTWGGFVFINMDDNAEPLLDYLSPIPEALAPFRLENMRYKWLKASIMDCNWKTGLDAFMEAYHVPASHPQLLRYDKYDTKPVSLKELERRVWSPTSVFGRHARFTSEQRKTDGSKGSRFDYPEDAPNERLKVTNRVQYFAKELRSQVTERDARAAEELLTADIPDGVSVPQFFMELRKQYALDEGLEWPELTREQLERAGTDWLVFPNTLLLPVQGSVLGYRSRPYGSNPDTCIFEAFDLEQIPVADYDKKWDFEPQFFEDWTQADLGGILDQDFGNMPHVTVGMHSPSFDGHRLSREQEMTVFHQHRVADTLLWD